MEFSSFNDNWYKEFPKEMIPEMDKLYEEGLNAGVNEKVVSAFEEILKDTSEEEEANPELSELYKLKKEMDYINSLIKIKKDAYNMISEDDLKSVRVWKDKTWQEWLEELMSCRSLIELIYQYKYRFEYTDKRNTAKTAKWRGYLQSIIEYVANPKNSNSTFTDLIEHLISSEKNFLLKRLYKKTLPRLLKSINIETDNITTLCIVELGKLCEKLLKMYPDNMRGSKKKKTKRKKRKNKTLKRRTKRRIRRNK